MMYRIRKKHSISSWMAAMGSLGILTILWSCEPWDLNRLDFPVVTTLEAESVTAVSATLQGEINGLYVGRIIEHGFVWSAVDPVPELDAPEVARANLRGRDTNGPFSFDLFPLDTNAIYYYRAYALMEGLAPLYGEVLSLQTRPAPLDVTMVRISRLQARSVSFTGALEGLPTGSTVLNHGFIWSSESRLPEVGTWDTLHLGPSRNNGCFTQKVDFEFPEDTTYYVFSFVETGEKSINSNRLSFTRRDSWQTSSVKVGAPPDTEGAVAFTIDNVVYFGAGAQEGIPDTRFWSLTVEPGAEPEPVPELPGSGLAFGLGFAIDGKGYVGTGLSVDDSPVRDFWVFDPSRTEPWSPLSEPFPGEARYGGVAFAIENRAYVGLGRNEAGQPLDDFWVYEAGIGWERLNASNTGPGARANAVAFVIDGQGYVGAGISGDNNRRKDFYRYDPGRNSWKPVADYPGEALDGAVAFALSGKGYVGLGSSLFGALRSDFRAYRPDLEIWELVKTFPGTPRRHALAFTLGNRGWIGLGSSLFQAPEDEFWQLPGDEIEVLAIADQLCPE